MYSHFEVNIVAAMPKPLPLQNPDLSRVNWISFTRDRRPEAISQGEEMPAAGNQQPAIADEGFSILLSALRRSQAGQAAQSRAGNPAPPAQKKEAEGKR